MSFLTPDRHAQGADVTATVERSKRDGVLAGRQGAEVHGVSLVSAIGNSVVGKHWRPSRAVDTRVRFFHFSGRVVNRRKPRVPIGP